MKDIVRKIEGNKLLIEVSNKIYEKDAILNSAYNFSKKCIIHIDPIDDHITGIYFEEKSKEGANLEEIAKDFCNDLIDQQLRLRTEKEFKVIREEIVKKAFSSISE